MITVQYCQQPNSGEQQHFFSQKNITKQVHDSQLITVLNEFFLDNSIVSITIKPKEIGWLKLVFSVYYSSVASV